jgi:hypothetical protein
MSADACTQAHADRQTQHRQKMGGESGTVGNKEGSKVDVQLRSVMHLPNLRAPGDRACIGAKNMKRTSLTRGLLTATHTVLHQGMPCLYQVSAERGM